MNEAPHHGWPPGPRGVPYFGSLGELRRDRLGFLSGLARDYGDFVPLRLRGRWAVFVNDPEMIETMLFTRAADFSKNNLVDLFHPALRNMLLFAEADSWLEQRRLARPALLPQRLPSYAKVMQELADRFCTTWVDGQVVDVVPAVRRLTLDILSRCLFDLDLAGIADEAPEIFDAVLDDVGARAFSPLYLSFLRLGSSGRLRKRIKRGSALLDRVIAARKNSLAERDDLMSALIRRRSADGRAFSDRELKLTLVPLFFAGHETTAMAISWAAYLIARHQDVQESLREELDTAEWTGPPAALIRQLPYLASVVHESLRLYPPIWGFGREAIRDTELGHYQIPAGTTLFTSQWVLQRDRRHFEAPAEFLPDRWSRGLAATLHRCIYMPFGAGPRRCLGSSFAVMETMLVIAAIFRRFRLEVVPRSRPEPVPLITLRVRGLRLMAHSRALPPRS